MGKRIHNLTGRKFGYLLAVKEAEPYINVTSCRKERQWHCLCACGNDKIIRQNSLLAGKTRSCGCLAKRDKGGLFERTEI